MTTWKTVNEALPFSGTHSLGKCSSPNIYTFLGHFLEESRNCVIFANFETTPLILPPICNALFVEICPQNRWWYHQLADRQFLNYFDVANLDGGWPSISNIHTYNHKKLRPGTALKYIIKMWYIFIDIIYHNIVMFITLVLVKTFSLW